jgi:hypothetical protein
VFQCGVHALGGASGLPEPQRGNSRQTARDDAATR